MVSAIWHFEGWWKSDRHPPLSIPPQRVIDKNFSPQKTLLKQPRTSVSLSDPFSKFSSWKIWRQSKKYSIARNPMDKFSFSFKRNQFKESKIYVVHQFISIFKINLNTVCHKFGKSAISQYLDLSDLLWKLNQVNSSTVKWPILFLAILSFCILSQYPYSTLKWPNLSSTADYF